MTDLETFIVRERIIKNDNCKVIGEKINIKVDVARSFLKEALDKLYLRIIRGSVSLEDDYRTLKMSLNELLSSNFMLANLSTTILLKVFSASKIKIESIEDFTYSFVLFAGPSFYKHELSMETYRVFLEYLRSLSLPFESTKDFRTYCMSSHEDKVISFLDNPVENLLFDKVNSMVKKCEMLRGVIDDCNNSISIYTRKKSETIRELNALLDQIDKLQSTYDINVLHRNIDSL